MALAGRKKIDGLIHQTDNFSKRKKKQKRKNMFDKQTTMDSLY